MPSEPEIEWTVVMPTHRPVRLKRSIKSIQDAHFGRMKVVIVAGDDETAKTALSMGFDVVPNPGPFVMAKAWNLGMNSVKTPYAFMFEDDARLITPLGIDELVRTSKSLKDSGILAPALQGDVLGHKIFSAGAPWEMTEISPKDFTLVAALIPMSVYAKVGPFDETFDGYGYDDTDYALRINDADMKVRIYQRVIVDHESYLSAFREKKPGEASLGEIAFINRCKFVAKHGRKAIRLIVQ
jgi:GT2 family glycosyltransferase